MNQLQIVRSGEFGAVSCDLYRGQNDEIYMTRDQVGRALEYADTNNAIQNIHSRNADRLDPLSTTLKLRGVDGKEREHTVYTAKGVYEICRLSRQPKADAFMDWVWDVIEDIRKGQRQPPADKPITAYQRAQLAQRQQSLDIHKAEVLARICEAPGINEYVAGFLAMNIADFLSGKAPRLPSGKEVESETYPITDEPPRVLPQLIEAKPQQKLYYPEDIARECGVSDITVRELARKHHMIPQKYKSNRFCRWAFYGLRRKNSRKRVMFTAEGREELFRLRALSVGSC